jgi:hypothetical protein
MGRSLSPNPKEGRIVSETPGVPEEQGTETEEETGTEEGGEESEEESGGGESA